MAALEPALRPRPARRTRPTVRAAGPSGPPRARPRTAHARHTRRVVVALVAVYVIWGSTYLAIEVAIGSMPPMLMLAARFAIAGGVLAVVAKRRRGPQGRVTFRDVRQSGLTGLMLLVGGTGLLVLAQTTLSSGLTALIAATVPLFLAIFARGIFGERLSAGAWLGLGVGIGGIALLVDPAGGQLVAITLALVASAAWAAGSLRSRMVASPQHPMTAASLEMLGAAMGFLVIGVLRGEFALVSLADVPTTAWFAFAYLVVAGSLVAYTAYSWLTRHAATRLVGTFAYVNPVVAVTLGWAVLGEQVSLRTLLAGGLVVISVVLLITGRPGEPVPAQVTSGGDVFAGVARWHQVGHRLGRLPRSARLYRDPGVRPYRRVGNEPPPGERIEDRGAR